MGKTITGIFQTIVGIGLIVVGALVPGMQWLIGVGIGIAMSGVQMLLTKSPKPNQSSATRLNKSLDPEAFRKIVFGRTVGGADLRYWEVYGTDDKQYDEIVAVAGHQVNAFKELWLEDQGPITATGPVTTGKFAGTVTWQTNTGQVGNAYLPVGTGAKWTSAAKFRGSAHYSLQWTYDQNKLPQGIPSRYTAVVEGALVYDPRKDSTVGGSGTMRYTDQTTWAYSTLDSNGVPIGRNNALQVLWYLLGWRIADTSGNQVLVCGRGVDPGDINWADFIAAANDAETLKYYTDCILSTGDSHQNNEGVLTADGVIGSLIDPGGMWSYFINKNDTAMVDVTLGDDDVVDTGPVEWKPYRPLADQYNRVQGTFVDPSATSLYQQRPYPPAINTAYETADGFKKRKTVNYTAIQDGVLAQRLSTVLLQEGRWQGEFTAKFNFRALFTKLYGVVSLNLTHYQFVNKLFRVLTMSVEGDGVTMRLQETDPSIWATNTPGTVNPGTAGGNGATGGAIPLSGVTLTATNMVSGGGTYPMIWVAWNPPSPTVTWVQVRYRQQGTTNWTLVSGIDYTHSTVNIYGVSANTTYEVQTQTHSTFRVFSGWSASILVTTGGYVAPSNSMGGNLIADGDFSGGTGAGVSGSWSTSAGFTRVQAV